MIVRLFFRNSHCGYNESWRTDLKQNLGQYVELEKLTPGQNMYSGNSI